MITSKQPIGFSQKLITLAILAALNPAFAAEGDVTSNLQGSVSAGLGIAGGNSSDRALFGQYNGLRNDNEHLLLDADVVNQNEATGIRTTFQGSNLGLDDRELRFSQQKQGDWKYSAEYGELARHEPRTINTGLQGIGTANLTADGNAAQTDVNLQTKRKNISLAMEKWFTPYLQFEANFKNEDRDGARLFGYSSGFGATSAMLLLPEPIDANIKQLDARLNFSGDKFLVSGAYYGSFYTNANGAMNLSASNLTKPDGTSGIATPAALLYPRALPPDNQAHQLSLAGNYTFTPTTHATFKFAKTHATQDDNFSGMGLANAPAGVNDLGGEVDTTLAQFGLTARPMPKLSVLANLRYEDKDDKTPIYPYFSTGNTNHTDPVKRVNGKLEANYQLMRSYRATLGVDYETINRGILESTFKPAGIDMLREETRELGWRAELKRSMSATVNGGISYISSRRNGSSWLSGTLGTPALSDAAIAALASTTTSSSMMDRQRDKVKLSADWTPTEKLSLQFMLEDGKDKYSEPHNATLDNAGLKDTRVRLYGVDASFALSDIWKLTGYVSQGEQTNHVNMLNSGVAAAYKAELESTDTAVGIGVRGKPSGKLDVGGDLSYLNNKNHYGQLQAAGLDLPDVTYRQTTFKLFGKYALEKNADIRVDFMHQHTSLNEWTWENFTYADKTTVGMKQGQNVAFIGATYIYKFK